MCINYFFLFLIFITPLFSEDELINSYLTSETDHLSLIEGVVNACNGKLVQIDRDIEIQGTDPLQMIRYYDGGHNYTGLCGYGTGTSFPLVLTISEADYVRVEQREGSFLPFKMVEKEKITMKVK